jgi:hypothetical protein
MNYFTGDPVIIIGMHRSGTTMISKMLAELGLFQGAEKDPNHEAYFFLEINDWLLRVSGGAWDYPLPFKLLPTNEAVRAKAIAFMKERMNKRRDAITYFGKASWKLKAHPVHYTGPWGWKDPRNTFTLPLWREIFPGAKIIHISRHGVDVAASLCTRNEKVLNNETTETGYAGISRGNSLCTIAPAIVDTLRCGTLQGGFSLWEEYMHEAQTQLQQCGDKGMSIRYEDFLAAPEESLKQLAQFCGLNVSRENCHQVAASAKKSRAFSFATQQELSSFADSVAPRLSAYGY